PEGEHSMSPPGTAHAGPSARSGRRLPRKCKSPGGSDTVGAPDDLFNLLKRYHNRRIFIDRYGRKRARAERVPAQGNFLLVGEAARRAGQPLLVEEAAHLAAAARVLELPQRLRLDLPDPLAGHRELLADLFQGVVGVHADAEAHAQHTLL